jgi:hypothetical protein
MADVPHSSRGGSVPRVLLAKLLSALLSESQTLLQLPRAVVVLRAQAGGPRFRVSAVGSAGSVLQVLSANGIPQALDSLAWCTDISGCIRFDVHPVAAIGNAFLTHEVRPHRLGWLPEPVGLRHMAWDTLALNVLCR